jgi:ferric-dicitrate binding protein FerR (iron transport regulator)
MPAAEIATLQTVTGAVLVTGTEFSERVVARAGMRLRAGDRVQTSEGSRAAFLVGGNGSIRLDRGTSVVLAGADRVRLDQGAVYVDTGAGPHESALHVQTEFGIVDHLGTQFEVRLHDRTLRVSVREGSVAVEHGGTRSTSHAGERLILAADRPVERQAIETFAADWRWTTDVASRFDLEGAAVPEFLDWATRELGMAWEYHPPDMGGRVTQIVLHGSIEGLTPDEALGAVLPTCGLRFYQERGRIIVTAQAK